MAKKVFRLNITNITHIKKCNIIFTNYNKQNNIKNKHYLLGKIYFILFSNNFL